LFFEVTRMFLWLAGDCPPPPPFCFECSDPASPFFAFLVLYFLQLPAPTFFFFIFFPSFGSVWLFKKDL